jgi:hypothetical protein
MKPISHLETVVGNARSATCLGASVVTSAGTLLSCDSVSCHAGIVTAHLTVGEGKFGKPAGDGDCACVERF